MDAGQVAIVTGGSSGIGQATSRTLAALGMQVVIVGRDEGRVRSTVESLAPPATRVPHLGLCLDVRSGSDMAAMAAESLAHFGRIDVLVTCAGVAAADGRLLPDPVASLPLSTWRTIIDTNVTGTFLANRAVLPVMARQGWQSDIVNIGSHPGGRRGHPFAAAYCASKFALIGLSDAMAPEARACGVRLHLLFPDAVDTPMLAGSRIGPVRLRPVQVADTIARLITLPPDCVLDHPIVAASSVSHARPNLPGF